MSARTQAVRLIVALTMGLLTLAALGAAWGQQPRARLNYEYRTIDPQPVTTGQRIEVIEFFWYGCPYCNQLQPALESWLSRMPADVELRRIPAIFRETWVPHARLYYTLEALDEVGRLHSEVYRSHHVDRDNLNTAESTANWAARHGVDRERWLTAYRSAEVDRRVDESRRHTRGYAIQGTPSLVVDGRYLTSSGMSESVPGVVTILEDLILIARERRTGR